MNKKLLLLAGFVFAGLTVSISGAQADDIDERQKAVTAQINEAAQTKVLTETQVKDLRKQLVNFNRKKVELKAAHSDVLTLDDDRELDKRLNAVSQNFEKLKRKLRAVNKRFFETPLRRL